MINVMKNYPLIVSEKRFELAKSGDRSIQVKVSSKVILSRVTILPPDSVSGSQTCTAASKTKSRTPLEVKHFFGALLSNT